MSGEFCAPHDGAAILSALLDTSDDGILHLDANGMIAGWSAGASRLYGYTAEEMIGSSITTLFPRPHREEADRLAHLVRSGASASEETVLRAKDGRSLNVRLSVVPIGRQPGTATGGALVLTRDLTALKKAEGAYRATEARWRAIIDAAVDGVIVIDSRGIIESFNTAAERLFGYRPDEMVGRSVNLLMPPPYRDEHDSYLATYVAGGPPKIIGIGREVTARRRNGEDFPARLAVGEASVDGEVRFIGIVHDLTPRMQIERRLRDQDALARMGEMAAIVAHEVRNALAGVKGAVQVIGARLPAGSREASAVDSIVARIDALTKIVKDMLLYAHLPAPRRLAVNVGAVVASAVRLAREDESAARLSIDVAGEAPPVSGDADLLQTVFLNLFINSAQAMQGTGTVRVQLDAAARSSRVVVSDQGPGVPTELRERLFSPFFTTKARGSGLGLATAKRIVEAHGGTLRAEFPATGGTTMIVEIPTAL